MAARMFSGVSFIVSPFSRFAWKGCGSFCPSRTEQRPSSFNYRCSGLCPRAALQGWPDVSSREVANDLPGVHFAQVPPVSAETLLQIVRGESPDDLVNEVLRALLGWVLNPDEGTWDDSRVPSEWRNDYPDGPPDFIGSADDYSPERDRPVKKAVQKLTRSIPSEHKQIMREVLGPMGFTGWKVNELTPNRTRRATAVNWIIYYIAVHYPEHIWARVV